MSHDPNSSNDGSPKNNDNPPPPPSSSSGIFYTRQRNKFTKTRNAASSARFRQNIRSRGGGGKKDDSWFARKSAGWTDDAIRSHLVGDDRGRQREDGFGMIGDVIQGVGVGTDTSFTSSNNKMASSSSAAKDDDDAKNEIHWTKKSRNTRRVVGTKFDWEEDDTFGGRDRNDTDGETNCVHNRGMMAPPPTLSDIMDEQDEIDFASRTLRVHQQKQQQQQHVVDGERDESDPSKQRKRRKNAALEELARITSGNVDGNSCSNVPAGGSDCVMDGSIGYRLLKALGYRSRLGMAIVPHSSSGRRQEQLHSHSQQQELNNAHISSEESIENEAKTVDIDDTLLLSKELSPRELSKWLSSKGLRAIRLPSIVHDHNGDGSVNSTTSFHDHPRKHQQRKHQFLLMIPPPKLDRHGIGYDPFANGPEFREFRERRLARARMLGRDGNCTNTGDRNTSSAGKRTKIHNGGDRYFTDNLRDDGRRKLWDNRSRKANLHDEHESDDDGDVEDEHQGIQQSHHHYAADRDFSDFVGTKSSSGFALEEDDDADVYNHDDNQNDQGDGGHLGGGGGEYTTEVQSPVASDAEDNGEDGGGVMPSSSNGRISLEKKRSRRTDIVRDVIDDGVIAEAWSAWGTDGIPGGKTDNSQRTRDGKYPLTGFVLGKISTLSSSNGAQPKRWAGPILPTGFLLKRHVFRDEVIDRGGDKFASGLNNLDGLDCGLGLNFQRRRQAHRRQVPTVLPPSATQHNVHLLTNTSPVIMLAKDGNEMNFHAVRESMKSRFVTSSVGSSHEDTDAQRSSTTAAIDDAANASEKNLDDEEWIRVTISPWIPTRLLCKRWGVPVPTSEGMTDLGGAMAGGITTRVRSNEETFFRDMVYDPSFVSRNHRDEGEKVATTAIDEEADSDDMVGHPLPSRPSEEIFRSIFNDESDMEISSSSSSSDNEEDIVARVVDDRTPNEAVKDVEDGVTLVPAAPFTGGTVAKVIDASSCPSDQQDAASIVASSSSSSSSSYLSVEASRQRRRHHNHHRTSRVNDGSRIDDDMTSDEKKRRRHSRSQHNHHRRERRRGQSLDDESHDDYTAKRISKDKKKHHRSRSRHSKKMR